MKIRRLSEPGVLDPEIPYSPFGFPVRSTQYLPIPTDFPERSFIEVLQERRSRRCFGQLSPMALSTLLWFSSKSWDSAPVPGGFRWQHRGVPSAGGRHPIHILVLPAIGRDSRAQVYDPTAHALLELNGSREHLISEFVESLNQIIPLGGGTVLWFIAEYPRTLCRYFDGESLVWRDAGALLAGISFLAEAMQLNCCAIGATGDLWVQRYFQTDLMGGVGGVVVGSKP